MGVSRGSTYALLHEDTELALIFDIDELLAAIGRVGDVQLLRRELASVFFVARCSRQQQSNAPSNARVE